MFSNGDVNYKLHINLPVVGRRYEGADVFAHFVAAEAKTNVNILFDLPLARRC